MTRITTLNERTILLALPYFCLFLKLSFNTFAVDGPVVFPIQFSASFACNKRIWNNDWNENPSKLSQSSTDTLNDKISQFLKTRIY